MIQTVKTTRPSRKDHVWNRVIYQGKDAYKCVLCGGVTFTVPPHFPTPAGWMPDLFEKLFDHERKLCRPVV